MPHAMPLSRLRQRVAMLLLSLMLANAAWAQQAAPARLPILGPDPAEKNTPGNAPVEKPAAEQAPADDAPTEATEEPSVAMKLWDKGQEALLNGKNHEAVAFFQRSLKLDPLLACNYLSLAAAYADQGEDELEALQLEHYLRLQPEHHVIRKQLADIRLRLRQPAEAHALLERFISDIQDQTELATDHLVVSHSKLAKIAELEEDSYNAHLHRGIGLFRLALQQAGVENSDKMNIEGLLCRAAGELTQARLNRPEEARPNWYLYEVWTRLAQNQPAQRALRAAESAAPFSYLTPTEQRLMNLALREGDLHR
jgi:hypothetical protein